MTVKRVPLFARLPEIYRIRDDEPLSQNQLEKYLALVEDEFGAIHENIEGLYHDLFIEFCEDWAIPYIGDLLGTSPLSGDAWTLRADVADTIALRRRKGTLGAIELLTFNLTEWGVHCVELLSSHSRQREADSYCHVHLPVVDGTTLEQIVLAQERGGDRTAQDLRKANQRDDISCCDIAVV